MPQKAVSVVQATTFQVSSRSVVPQEKLRLAYKLLGVSNRITRVLVFLDRVVCTDLLVCNFWQKVLEQGSSQPPDNSELDALRER